ncbi:MAG TPA: carboxypeptidase-like regulatory domain-containing protein [Pyrinomonadaceae bacterium]|nr:carboxypeptidase-like regulatory domain-containing protein [Pyrinomonadaceae bacterium]
MRFTRFAFVPLVVAISFLTIAAQDRTTGTLKGKVRAETGSAAGVTVLVRQGEQEVRRTETDKNGEFSIRLAPGNYGLTFRKPGLSVGTIENVEVKAGKTRSLGDRLILTIDEGSIAFIRGSVFSAEGRSVPNARIELGRLLEDGTVKKIDGRITNETGSFVFRLSPEVGKYRVTVKPDGGQPVSQDMEIDGAAVYRVALSLPPKS